MSGQPIDALSVMDALVKFIGDQTETYDDDATALLARAVEARTAVAELIEAMHAIDYAADHHHTGCPAGPMQRMPANLREAILTARAALARLSGAPQL